MKKTLAISLTILLAGTGLVVISCGGGGGGGDASATYYADADGDGYGDVNVSQVLGSAQCGWVLDSTDCDDTPGPGASTHPNAVELCDNVDNDCDGQTDEGICVSTQWFHPTGIDDFVSFDVSPVAISQVVMNSGGDVILVWEQPDTNYSSTTNFTRVYMSERDGSSGTWTHPADVTGYISPDGGPASPPSAAMDDSGNAIVAWSQWDMAGSSWIFVSERDGATGTWTHPADLADHIAPSSASYWPEAAIGGNGDALVAWSENGVGSATVYFSERSGTAGAWPAPEVISVSVPATGTMVNIGKPDASIDDCSDAIMAWSQSEGFMGTGGSWIFVSERVSDVWTHPSVAGDSIAVAGSEASNPKLAMAGNGEAVISWFEKAGAYSQVYVAQRDGTDGTWTYPADLFDKLSPDGSNARFNRSAVNSGGEAVVVWRQYDGSNDDQIFMSERDGGTGLWDNPADISDNISPDGFDAGEREVDMDDNGHAVVAWKQDVAVSGTEAMFLSERAGYAESWVHPVDINDFISPAGGGIVGGSPSVAVGGNGNAIVIWRQDDGAFDRLYMSEKK